MFSLRDERAHERTAADPFRGTTQRWVFDAGPLAGTACDHAFNEDWSLVWRVVAGLRQGRTGRARQFHVQAVRAQLYLVSFPAAPDVFIAATVDLASRRLAGFQYETGRCLPFSGSIRVL